jgi:hypothetical protein
MTLPSIGEIQGISGTCLDKRNGARSRARHLVKLRVPPLADPRGDKPQISRRHQGEPPLSSRSQSAPPANRRRKELMLAIDFGKGNTFIAAEGFDSQANFNP